MPSVVTPGRRYWIAYPSWIALCAVVVALLSGVPDDSVTKSVASAAAGRKAAAILRQQQPARFASYEAVSVAYSGRGESGGPARWVVLCDSPERKGLDSAAVVEIEAKTGRLIRIRAPGR